MIHHEIKRKLRKDQEEKQELLKKLNENLAKNKEVKFVEEYPESNVLQCQICESDTFQYWVQEEKKNGYHFYCIKCAIKNIENVKQNLHKYKFYFKYFEEEIYTLFGRLEKRIKDPNHMNDEFQNALLLKSDWPNVRTKQNLYEEGKPVNFYKNPIRSKTK